MANTLGIYNPVMYATEALAILKKRLGVAQRVYHGIETERRSFQKGDTISIKRPSTFVVASAPSTAADLQVETVTMTMTNWKEVKFKLSDKELAYTTEQIIADHIAPAAYALADDIDQALISNMSLVGFANAASASNVSGDSATFAATQLTNLRKMAFNAKIPLQDIDKIHLMVNGTTEADILGNATVGAWTGQGSAGTNSIIDATIGRRYGMNIFANQNAGTATNALHSIDTNLNSIVASAAAIGATSIVLTRATLTGTITRGSIITVEGYNYTVLTNATASGNSITLSVSPPVQGAAGEDGITAGAAVTFVWLGDNTSTPYENLMWHRDAVALVMVPLPETGSRLGAQVFTVQDPVSGLSIRARLYYVGNSSEVHVALDTLYGTKVLNPYLGVRWIRRAA